jgi:hypothetical protein
MWTDGQTNQYDEAAKGISATSCCEHVQEEEKQNDVNACMYSANCKINGYMKICFI